MIYNVYAIRDSKTGFLQPTCEMNDASAMRNFEHAVMAGPDSLFFSHPEDYALYRLGSYDTDKGVILPESPIVNLIEASAVLVKLSSMKGGISNAPQG